MRQLFILSLLSCAALAVGTASAKSSSKGKGNYQGTIVAVTKSSIVVDVGTDRPHKVTFKVDGKTAITSGSEKGTIADLAKGQIVTIDNKADYATKIDVTGIADSGS